LIVLCIHAAVTTPIFSSTGVRTEEANPAAKSAPNPGTKAPNNQVLGPKSSRRRQSLTTRAGAFRPGPRSSGGLFELRHDLLFGLNQLGHHGGVKNALAMRRRKLFRCTLRIPLPRQAVVPLHKRLCLALGSSLRPMSVPAVCPDSLATKFKSR